MSDTPLEKLHLAFTEALRTHTYVGPTESDPLALECTKNKHIRLKEVFERALEQIETDLENDHSPLKDVSLLRTLNRDGNTIYQRYVNSTNSWSRWFLKCLARYTPDLLKNFLPACFSNEMEKAEEETLEAFEKYRSFLKEKIAEFRAEEQIALTEECPDGEDIFDADQDLPSTEDKAKDSKTPTKKEDAAIKKQADLKRPIKAKTPTDPKKEAELKTLREGRLKFFDKTPPGKEGILDEEDLEMQRLLSEIYLQEENATDKQPTLSYIDSSPVKVKKEKVTVDPAVALDNLLKSLYENEEDAKIAPIPSEDSVLSEEEFANESLDTTSEWKMRYLSTLLTQCDQFPLGLQKLKKTLEDLAITATAFITDNPRVDTKSFFKELDITDKALDTLTDPKLIAALQAQEDQKVLELLDATPWRSPFQEALEQKGYITFGLRKILGQSVLALGNEEGKPVKESLLIKYRGQIKMDLSTDLLNELLKFLENNKACRPYSVVIEAGKGESFTPELFRLLMQLKDRVGEVQVEKLREMNFKELGISEDAELDFVRHLHLFHFPDLENIILSDHAKRDWMPKDFSHLLAICPTMELLKASYQQCPSYKEIVIPAILTDAQEADVSGCSIDQANHLLSLFSHPRYINLYGLPYTDSQLYHLLKQPHLKNVVGLQLDTCKGLTTDSLPTLAALPQLRTLGLPDLPKGKLPLNELPTFENPFKIKLLYTASKATQPLAMKLYTGPQIWAAVFQIPLARQGAAEIFAPHQQRLDPKSVAYWLYADDYQQLKPQTSIRRILADSNSLVNDDHLVEFVQKFPNTTLVSLYNCPHVTEAGVIRLLQACPKIQTLDLRGCRQINESLFLGEGNLAILKKLKKLMVADTGITSDIAATFNTPDQLGATLVFEDTCLKITDADLTDDDALENILQKHTLNELKRIDLEDCVNLNNKMLGQLLDHLNAPEEITTPEKTKIDNPQRLNLAVLNLKGCVNITEAAFDNPPLKNEEGEEAPVKAKIEPKFLGNLDRVITGGTKIADVLKEVYPHVIFQQLEEPVTMEIDPEKQCAECLDDAKKESSRYLHNRIVVELFCDGSAQEVIEQPIDTQSKDFCDMTLSFKTDDDAELISFQVHRDILYYQSLFFPNKLKPGGTLSKSDGITYVNVHATAEATQAMVDILYDKPCIPDLDWETASHVAELVGPKNFQLPDSIYKAVLNRIHSQFDLTNAQKLLEIATCLNDQEGKKEYENTLIYYLDNLGPTDQDIFQAIANIAGGKHGLKALERKVTQMQEKQTNQLKKEITEKNAADAAAADAELIQQMVEDEKQKSLLGRYFF